MIRPIACALLCLSAIPAQELSTIERAADAMIEGFVPSKDDPHATIEHILKAAEEVRATQIGASLVGVLYVLDEPSVGLHARDNARLLDALRRLVQQGVTVTNVESALFEWLGRYRHPAFASVTAPLHEGE